MVLLNTEVATVAGVLVATRVERFGIEVFVIFLIISAGIIKEVFSAMSRERTITKLNQMIRG